MIYRKTERGTAELAQRSGAVERRLRPLLILVDGQRSMDQLYELASGIGVGMSDFRTLESMGLIEPIASAQTAASQTDKSIAPRSSSAADTRRSKAVSPTGGAF